MARFRIARRAHTDFASILAESAERWGAEARGRYQAALIGGMRQVASDPEGPLTRECRDIRPDLRSFHLRHLRQGSRTLRVRRPAHVIYYRVIVPGFVEIVRVLHERMEPARQFADGVVDPVTRRRGASC
jgi:toxin ParE1/3/4